MTNHEPGNERKIANCPWLSKLILAVGSCDSAVEFFTILASKT